MTYVAMGPPDEPTSDKKLVLAAPVFVLGIYAEVDGWVSVHAVLYSGEFRQVYRFEVRQHQPVVSLAKAEAASFADSARSGVPYDRRRFVLEGRLAGFDVNPGLDGRQADGANWLKTMVLVESKLEAM